MNDYKRNDFFITNDEKNNKKYFVRIKDQMVEVPKDVFSVCYNSYRKELRDGKRDQEFGLISYDMELENNHSLLDFLSIKEIDILETMVHKERYEKLMNIINQLNSNDKDLIIELLVKHKKEKDLARQYKVARQAINKRKHQIIKKIKRNFNK